jgi:hypothetical protein
MVQFVCVLLCHSSLGLEERLAITLIWCTSTVGQKHLSLISGATRSVVSRDVNFMLAVLDIALTSIPAAHITWPTEVRLDLGR